MSIVKRRKTSDYAQIHNGGLQDLDDLNAIGMLAHLMSLPEDWVIIKTNLYDKFTRKTVDNAFKYLMEKGYLIGGWGYGMKETKKGMRSVKQYEYVISDIPFTQDEVYDFIADLKSKWSKVQVYQGILSTVQNEQYEENSSENTHTKEIGTNETDTNKYLKDVNKENPLTPEIINDFLNHYISKGIDKKLFQSILGEVQYDIKSGVVKFPIAYFKGALDNVVKVKQGIGEGNYEKANKDLPTLQNKGMY
jgi:hypothetical protein